MTRKYFAQIVMVIQVILDFCTIVISFRAGYYFYNYLYESWNLGVGVQPFRIYRNLSIGAGILFLIIFERFGLYSRKVGVLNVEEIKRILQSLILGSLILFSLSFLLRPVISVIPGETMMSDQVEIQDGNLLVQGTLLYSRLILLYSLSLALIFINLQRSAVNRVLLKMHVKGPGLNRVLIYGAGEVGKQLNKRLYENPRIGMKPIGFVDDDLDKVGEDITRIGGSSGMKVKVLGNGPAASGTGESLGHP